jgi:hypothetical protein
MVEKATGEIGRMGTLRKQNEDGVKSTKAEDWLGNVERGRVRWMMGSWNVEVDGENLRSLAVAGGTSAEDAGRSRDVEFRNRQRGGRRERSRRLNTSIRDCRSEMRCRQYLENGWCDDWEKLIDCRG